jgi:hypothetical protein
MRKRESNPAFARMSFPALASRRRVPRWPARGRRHPVALLLAAVVLATSGCASHYVLELESHRQLQAPTDLNNASFHVAQVIDTSEHEGTKLHKLEVEKYLRQALATRGMYPAPGPAQAAVHLEVQYGAGPSRIEVTEVTNPSMGLHKAVRAEQVREKYFRLTARTPAPPENPGGPGEILWNVEVRNLDDRSELRRYLPIMIAVAAEWAAKNTHGRRTFTATMENGTVIIVSGGYDQPGISPDAPP